MKKQQTLEDNLTEISNQVFGDTLSENPSVAESAFGTHRVITDRWKGMSPAEINAIRYTRQKQIEEKQRLKEDEDQMNQEWSKQTLDNSKAAVMLEHQQERLRKELMRKQAEENLRLSSEQKSRLDHLNKDVYSNIPTAAYFMQFNTSSR